ncbi:MAG: alpha/beta hydrolase [Gloeomargarita sp. SKYBB_i_bin120]|nr:alpha/beta hydrolase [Gloeomargarita sp. SKYG98]MCS7291949.1 alpha/beta hydrolase [Gloeomargarita sp. SKYB120]MDW8177509.1 alpha/beta hydrolase [Gloeomargarita sp. SKYBB_i_bin120]
MRLKHGVWGIGVALALGMVALPAQAARTVNFWFNIFEVASISVPDLRRFVDKNELSPSLRRTLQLLPERDRQGFEQVLRFKLSLEPRQVIRLVDSPSVEQVLMQIPPVFLPNQSPSVMPGLKGALILASIPRERGGFRDKDGFGLVNVLEAYPAQEMNLDIPALLRLGQQGLDLQRLLGGGLLSR